MAAQSIGAEYRAVSDRILRKTLAIGLGGSALLHTAAIAGASYFYQENIDDLKITEIERVELPPPVTKPVAPTVKPRPVPEPKVFKPKVIAEVPKPVPVKIPQPEPVLTPPAEVKITKSAAKPQTARPVRSPAPVPRASTAAPLTPPKSNPPPSFPKKLFNDPQPKPPQAEIPDRKIPATPPQDPPAREPQPVPDNQPALAPTAPKRTKIAAANPDSTDNPPIEDELIPSSPGNTSKLSKTPDRSAVPASNNQTSLATQPKSPPKFGDGFGAADPNPAASSDDFAGTPGSNTRIANNIPAQAPANNQAGLGNAPRRSGIGANLGSSGSDNPSGDEEPSSGAPGNNTRIARSNSGGKGVGSQGNQTSLGGGNRRTPALGGSLNGGGNGDGSGSENDLGGGKPGNIATGSKNQATIQCLRNCEIRYPDELKGPDVGKDKILVRVTIDPNGSITSAEIARSSGNQDLDRVSLAGLKQMQLTPTGKIQKHRINLSILLNN